MMGKAKSRRPDGTFATGLIHSTAVSDAFPGGHSKVGDLLLKSPWYIPTKQASDKEGTRGRISEDWEEADVGRVFKRNQNEMLHLPNLNAQLFQKDQNPPFSVHPLSVLLHFRHDLGGEQAQITSNHFLPFCISSDFLVYGKPHT